VYDLHLVSQTWQGANWEHRVQIFRPDKVAYPDFCVLLNTGGNGGDRETAASLALANAAGVICATVYNIPNQPLYGGKREDELIAYTWQKFLETGDETWPLQFPMTKSVLKSMDAIQAFAKSAKQPPISRFLVTGASKRGWTAWLVGASRDPRVVAIAPMVIDMLNMPAQIPHQLAAYGKPSEQVSDYTNAGLIQQLTTPKGKRLVALVDPYQYRDRLALPKLIVLGTNDRYWSQDALNLYWSDLRGPKSVLYVPNSGHGLQDTARVFATISAFARAQAARKPWPRLAWTYGGRSDGSVALTLLSESGDIAPKSARLWRAHAPTRDFRDAKWTFEPMTPASRGKGAFAGQQDAPKTASPPSSARLSTR
jgi:PhoPQ-activated pathogenicity-related protein